MDREYILDSASDLGRQQLDCLQTLLDPQTTACLDAVGVRPGQRCLDLGAGGGSITGWLADRVGPTGTVVSVDLDIDHITQRPGVEVYRHDINDGLPVDGPFDLIHARLVLLHLARREEILKTLVDALAPCGWLVLGEFTGPQQHVLSAPSEADAELFRRVQELGHRFAARERGVSLEWAHEVDGHMAKAGLVDIRSLAFSMTNTGGDPGCLLHRNYVLQLEPMMLQAGLTARELAHYRQLMLDPRFRAWFYQFICTRGQRPTGRDATHRI